MAEAKKIIPAYFLTFVNSLAVTILMPVLPFIVESYQAPKWMYGLLLGIYSAFQFLGAPYLGSLSDSLGRKPIIIVSQAGTLLSWFVFFIALSLPEMPVLGLALPLWIIGFARLLDGLTGGNVSVTNAYVSDSTSREEKSYIFGYLGGVSGLAVIIGPGIGGLTAASPMGYSGTILTAAAISVVTLLTIFLWLKESLPKEKRLKRKKQSVLHSFLLFKRIKNIRPAPITKLIFLLKLIFSIMMATYISAIPFFVIDLFGFNEKELGFFMFFIGFFLIFNQVFVLKRLIKKFGEFRTLLIGLSLSSLGFFSITVTDNLYFFIPFYYVLNLGISLCFPVFNALISIRSEPKKQGEIMGVSESIHAFAMAVFPAIGAGLYGLIQYRLFYLISLLPLAALLIALYNIRKLKINTS